jgi:predicted nucleic acid-binding protein
MVERYLLDTNALIDYLAGTMPAKGLVFMDSIFDSGDIILSVITQIEVLAFQAPVAYLEKVQRLISVSKVIPLAEAMIINQSIFIRRETRIKLPDAVIAATALSLNLTIVSRNVRDFSRITGLAYIDPHKLT